MTRMGGGAVGWASKLQPVVAQSTTEAEFVAAMEAGKEICWMRNLLELVFSPSSQDTIGITRTASSSPFY